MTDSETLTPTEAGELLKLSPKTVVRLIRSGKLRGSAVGNGTKRHRWVIKRSDVMAYLEQNVFEPERNIEPPSKPRIEPAHYPMFEKYRRRLGL